MSRFGLRRSLPHCSYGRWWWCGAVSLRYRGADHRVPLRFTGTWPPAAARDIVVGGAGRQLSSGWSAGIAAASSVVAFWIGLWRAAWSYPFVFDWRYTTISSLLYSDRNPDGHAWGVAGLAVS